MRAAAACRAWDWVGVMFTTRACNTVGGLFSVLGIVGNRSTRSAAN